MHDNSPQRSVTTKVRGDMHNYLMLVTVSEFSMCTVIDAIIFIKITEVIESFPKQFYLQEKFKPIVIIHT